MINMEIGHLLVRLKYKSCTECTYTWSHYIYRNEQKNIIKLYIKYIPQCRNVVKLNIASTKPLLVITINILITDDRKYEP